MKLSFSQKPITFVVLACGLLAVYFSMLSAKCARNRPLDKFAQEVVAALDSGDTRFLYDAMHSSEKAALGLSHEEFNEFYKWYRNGSAGVTNLGDPILEEAQEGYMLVLTIPRRSANDRCDLSIIVNRTEDGPKCFLTASMSLVTLTAKYSSSDDALPHKERYWRAMATGLEKERATLESMGIKGFVNTSVESKVTTWKRYQQIAEQRVASQMKQLVR